MKKSLLPILLFLVTCLSSLVTAFGQEIAVSVPIHNTYTYSRTGPLMRFQQAPGNIVTGNETEWRDKTGALVCWADANGQLNCVGGLIGSALTVQHNGVVVGSRNILNVIDSSNVIITATDNPGQTRVDLTWLTTPTRDCTIVAGSNNGAALVNADVAPQSWQCKVPRAATVLEIDIHSDAGTSSVTPNANVNGAQTSLLSAPLVSSANEACANVAGGLGLDGVTTCAATLQNTSIAAGSYFETLTATTTGAHIVSVSVIFTMP